MRALKAAVVVMTVLIIVGVAVIGATIAQRLSGNTAPVVVTSATLDEPEGTRIVSIATAGDHLAVQLQGGGSDRVLILDTRSGRMLLRAALIH